MTHYESSNGRRNFYLKLIFALYIVHSRFIFLSVSEVGNKFRLTKIFFSLRMFSILSFCFIFVQPYLPLCLNSTRILFFVISHIRNTELFTNSFVVVVLDALRENYYYFLMCGDDVDDYLFHKENKNI